MTGIQTLHITVPAHLRKSLARGLARDAFARAPRAEGAVARVLDMLGRTRPNLRNRRRGALRLARVPGVVACAIRADGFEMTLRVRREMILCDDAGEQFRADVLVYTQVRQLQRRGNSEFLLRRVILSPHAVERLIQRSDCPLEGVLATADAEAAQMFDAGADLPSTPERAFRRALRAGVWAGSMDESLADDGWPVDYRAETDRRIPTFTARTFLSPDEMDPVTWLHWQGDDRLAMTA